MNSRFFRSPFLKLTVYYAILVAVGYVLVSRFDMLNQAFSLARLDQLAGSGFLDANAPPSAGSMRTPEGSAMLTIFAIAGSLALLAPVAWVYMLTKHVQGYDESVVHTVMILPVPIIGLVIVVQDSIALAFSLTGIVAAVRFRNTLKDTKDAVYIFLAIGTALAAAVQGLGVAAVTSIVFNYLVLIMWRTKIGNIYADQGRRVPRMRLGDALAGAGSKGSGLGNLTIGDPDMIAALAPRDLRDIAARKARLVDKVRSSEGKKFNGLLIIYGEDSQECLEEIEQVLDDETRAYELTEISAAADGNATVEYLVTLEKGASGSALVSRLRERVGEHISAAELRILDRKSLSK